MMRSFVYIKTEAYIYKLQMKLMLIYETKSNGGGRK